MAVVGSYKLGSFSDGSYTLGSLLASGNSNVISNDPGAGFLLS